MRWKKREPGPSANERQLFVPLVGMFDLDHPTPIIAPGPDDEFTKKLDELEEFHRKSERLRDLV